MSEANSKNQAISYVDGITASPEGSNIRKRLEAAFEAGWNKNPAIHTKEEMKQIASDAFLAGQMGMDFYVDVKGDKATWGASERRLAADKTQKPNS